MIEIQEIVFDERTISNKVRELADAITRDYAGKDPVLDTQRESGFSG